MSARHRESGLDAGVGSGDGRGRSNLPRRDRWREVVEGAMRVFSRKGYRNASVQDVADEVGLLKGSLYYYINTKEDLLFSVFELAHAGGVEIVEEVQALDAPPLTKLHAYLERFVRYYLLNPEQARLYFREAKSLNEAHYEEVLTQRRMYDDFVTGLIREAQARGDVSGEWQPKYCAYFILGAINGLTDWYDPEGSDPPETIARIYADQSLAMLTGDPSR